MKTSLAVLSAVLSLTAFSVGAEAAPRGQHGMVIEVDRRAPRDDARAYDRRDRRDFDRHDERLSERQIERMLLRRGFVDIDDIELRRDRYIVRAVRPNGALVRLALDAYDGEVLARERLGWVRGYGRERRDRRDGIEFRIGNGSIGIYGR